MHKVVLLSIVIKMASSVPLGASDFPQTFDLFVDTQPDPNDPKFFNPADSTIKRLGRQSPYEGINSNTPAPEQRAPFWGQSLPEPYQGVEDESIGPVMPAVDDTGSTISLGDQMSSTSQKGSETDGINLMMNVLKNGEGFMHFGKGDGNDNGYSLMEMKVMVLKPLKS